MVTFSQQLQLNPQCCPYLTYCIHIDSGMCHKTKVTNQGSVCIIAGANTESSREPRVVINLLPQQSVGLYFLPLLRTVFFEFSLRTHLFSKMIQHTHWRHIHKALYCMLFVMFESFGELITLKHIDERGNILYRVHLRKQPTYRQNASSFSRVALQKNPKKHNHASHNAQSWVWNHAA